MNYFFTSDTHFGHEGIIKHVNRGFETAAEVDEAIVERWNEVVGKKDTIFHLGDLSFKNAEYTHNILKRLNGVKHWIKGNHDKARQSAMVTQHFASIQDLKELKVQRSDGGYDRIVMCHYPMLTWNKAHYGSWMLHGHSHGTLKHPYEGMRLMDVGCDTNNLTPYSLDDVRAYMDGRGHTTVDHHTTKE